MRFTWSKGFCEFEVASVLRTLTLADRIADQCRFQTRFVAEGGGMIVGSAGMMVRATPAIPNHDLRDVMIVPGGVRAQDPDPWLRRARAMQRLSRPVVLLSDAATAYIRAVQSPAGKVTTHWRDIPALSESGYHPNLTMRLSENSNGIFTAAGEGATAEVIIGLIAPHLQHQQLAELGNHLLLPVLRKADAQQPKEISESLPVLDARVRKAIQLMETNVAEPLSMTQITTQAGLSTRHLERAFRAVFDDTPARFYKALRARRAKSMVEDTSMAIVDIAVATGFGSSAALSKAVLAEYGQTPFKMRSLKRPKTDKPFGFETQK